MDIKKNNFVYLDNAATTPVTEAVLEQMLPFYIDEYGNPSSIYHKSQKPKIAIEEARRTIAGVIGASPNEIFFTSGATEANNWAIIANALEHKKEGKNHIISTSFEHLSVIRPLKFLESQGFKVTYIPVDSSGNISLNALMAAIRKNTFLITIMTINNEIGNILPIKEIGEIARDENILFHSDGVQAIANMKINVNDYKFDMLSLSAHKFGGPKGVGALYINKNMKMPSFIHGGDQERRYRAGTENVAGIIGMGMAIKESTALFKTRTKKLEELGEKLKDGLLEIEESYLIGDENNKIPSIITVGFKHVVGESALLMLDMEGIAASSGSACSSGALAYSHVLQVMGIKESIARGAIRFSLGDVNTNEDIDYTVKTVKAVVKKLRQLSPNWEKEI